MAVVGGVQAPGPRAGQPGHHRAEVAGAEQAGVEPELARDGQPLLEARQRRVVIGEREVAALYPLDIGAQLALEAAPEPVRLHHQRHLGRIAPLLPHESPVLARLLARHAPALHDRHAHTAPRQEVRGRAADDAGPHHDDIRLPLHGRPHRPPKPRTCQTTPMNPFPAGERAG